MQAVRAVITGQTASFRVPYFISLQLTLPVPPPSTVRGLIHALAGRWVDDLEWFAYRFEYADRFTDLEKLHKYESSGGLKTRELARAVSSASYSITEQKGRARYGGTTIMRREVLYAPRLYLYLPPEWENVLRNPRGVLSLGRSQDLAGVEEVRPVEIAWRRGGIASGILLESEQAARAGLAGVTHALPVGFTREQPRRPIAVRSFVLVDCHHAQRAQAELPCDGDFALAYFVTEESSTSGYARTSEG